MGAFFRSDHDNTHLVFNNTANLELCRSDAEYTSGCFEQRSNDFTSSLWIWWTLAPPTSSSSFSSGHCRTPRVEDKEDFEANDSALCSSWKWNLCFARDKKKQSWKNISWWLLWLGSRSQADRRSSEGKSWYFPIVWNQGRVNELNIKF